MNRSIKTVLNFGDLFAKIWREQNVQNSTLVANISEREQYINNRKTSLQGTIFPAYDAVIW